MQDFEAAFDNFQITQRQRIVNILYVYSKSLYPVKTMSLKVFYTLKALSYSFHNFWILEIFSFRKWDLPKQACAHLHMLFTFRKFRRTR